MSRIAIHIMTSDGKSHSFEPGVYFTFDEDPDSDECVWSGPYENEEVATEAAIEAIKSAAIGLAADTFKEI